MTAEQDLGELETRLRSLEVSETRLKTLLEGVDKALELQATEYERRLQSLNNENARIANVLAKSVAQDRFDDYVKSEHARVEELSKTSRQASELALDRVNEKFDDFVRKYELRQREVDAILSGQQAVSQALQKTFTRNVAIATILLTMVVIAINIFTTI